MNVKKGDLVHFSVKSPRPLDREKFTPISISGGRYELDSALEFDFLVLEVRESFSMERDDNDRVHLWGIYVPTGQTVTFWHADLFQHKIISRLTP